MRRGLCRQRRIERLLHALELSPRRLRLGPSRGRGCLRCLKLCCERVLELPRCREGRRRLGGLGVGLLDLRSRVGRGGLDELCVPAALVGEARLEVGDRARRSGVRVLQQGRGRGA